MEAAYSEVILIEERPERSGRAECERRTNRDGEGHECQCAGQHKPYDARTLRAESHAHIDLARTSRDGVADEIE
jgi:hypothetical protein